MSESELELLIYCVTVSYIFMFHTPEKLKKSVVRIFVWLCVDNAGDRVFDSSAQINGIKDVDETSFIYFYMLKKVIGYLKLFKLLKRNFRPL